jgi:hypothetical protein
MLILREEREREREAETERQRERGITKINRDETRTPLLSLN